MATIVLRVVKEEKVLVADEENLTNALLKVIREGKKWCTSSKDMVSTRSTIPSGGILEAKRAIKAKITW
jgi:hypothetical protein